MQYFIFYNIQFADKLYFDHTVLVEMCYLYIYSLGDVLKFY